LSKIAALKVISRSSTQRYKSAPDNLRDVGKQLGVANLLEGSVQKVANAVHVNVQLIRAANDEHLWAESYNRKLDDVFGVEGEVASAIADQLKTKLSGAEQKAVAEKPTQNAAAYDVYLHAVAIDDAATLDVTKQVVPLYAETVRLDPQFALAWARLSIARSQLYFNGIDLETNTGAKVKEEADRAIALQPELGEAWLAQGVYRYRVLRDFQGALQSYEEALRRLPNSAFVLEQMGHLERRLGQFDAAQKHYEVAVQLDPRNIGILSTVADTLQSLRRFAEAQTMLDRVLEISPGNESVLARKAAIFQGQGRLKEAAEVLAKIPANSKEDDVTIQRFVQLYDERQFDEAIAYVQHNMPPSLANDPRTITFLGICQKLSGKTNEVRNTFTRAVAAFKPTPDAVVPIDARQLPCYLALAYAYLGEKDKALEQARQAVSDYATDALSKPLAEAYLAIVQAQFGDIESGIAALPHLLEVPNGETAGDLRINPLWDPLRNDPRFQKLSQEK
jgi:tetratricopeptide (TPR) repeat protein